MNEQPQVVENPGFKRTPWINETIQQAENLALNEGLQTTLPADVDIHFFIAELGRPSRDFEIGGVFNPKTRSILLRRGVNNAERQSFMAAAHVGNLPLRRNADQTTDDISFHTHPWKEQSTDPREAPVRRCQPSTGDDSDVSTMLSFRAIEEEVGQDTKIVAIVSAGGYITICEAAGVRVEETVLKDAGLSDEQIREVKVFFGLEWPLWALNWVRKDDPTATETMRLALDRWYWRKKHDFSVSPKQRMQDFLAETRGTSEPEFDRRRGYVRQSEILAEHLYMHFPSYPSVNHRDLQQLGLSREQIELLISMAGYSQKTYQVIENKGLEEIQVSGW